MRGILRQYFLVLVVGLLTFSCKNKSEGYKPVVAGKAGELLIVIDGKWKNTKGGKYIRQMMIQPYLGLPQEEPIFDIMVAPHDAFTSYMKTIRNIVVADISSGITKDTIHYYKSLWAKEQAVVRVSAKTPEAFEELIRRHELKMISFFNRAERERSMRFYKGYSSAKLMNKLKRKWDCQIIVPGSFRGNRGGQDFVWMSEEKDLSSQGLLVYSFDYVGKGTFSKEYLLNKRDSVLKINLPGAAAGSYMTTEHTFPVIYKKDTINENEVYELRGLWKVQGDMMGGPFILQARLDKRSNKVIVTDGYVYAPEQPKKRTMIRQLEAVMYSFRFSPQKK